MADTDRDPFLNWDHPIFRGEVTSLLSRGLEHLDEATFFRGALLAQDDTYYMRASDDIEYTADEKKFLNWEHGLSDSGKPGHYGNKFKQPVTLWLLVAVCCLGAAVQGHDESAVNGAQLYYHLSNQLDIDRPEIVGLINSAPYFVCVLCCWVPALLKPLGRRGAIAITCIVSFAACLGQALAPNVSTLLAFRLLLGLGIGPKSAIIPIFASECVPRNIRGALVMTWQMWTAAGIMVGFIFGAGFAHVQTPINGLNWRLMLGSPMIVPFALAFLVFSQPESPRWLLERAEELSAELQDISESEPSNKREWKMKGYYKAAYIALARLRNTPVQAARDFVHIRQHIKLGIKDRKKGKPRPWKKLLTSQRDRQALSAGMILMFFQQFCGVNVLAYYSGSVFAQALTGNNPIQVKDSSQDATFTAVWLSFGFGLINFLFALPALKLIDSFGRRPLLLVTFPCMALSQLMVAIVFAIPYGQRYTVPIFAYIFAMFYSVGEGPVPFVYSSESLPISTRDQGMGVLTSINWGLNALLALTWPSMSHTMSYIGAFLFYAGWCFAGFFAILFLVPETKKLTLEQLDNVFSHSTRDFYDHGRDELKWFFRELLSSGINKKWEKPPVLRRRNGDDSDEIGLDKV